MLIVGGFALTFRSSLMRASSPPVEEVMRYKGCLVKITPSLIKSWNCFIASGVVAFVDGFVTAGLSSGTYLYNRDRNIKKLNAQITDIDKQIRRRIQMEIDKQTRRRIQREIA